jgi:5-formyltetrahydrofolate cyclo-ligase
LKQQKEEDRRRKSEAIRRKLGRLSVFRRAGVVMCFVSLPYEVETRRLMTQMLELGKRVVVPRVKHKELVLSELKDPRTDLAPGSFGVWEPKASLVRPVRLDELGLVLVPGLAFDRTGHRLGHGHGYFDRLLGRLPHTTPTIGLCFDFQLVDRLPTRPHDQAVQHVLSA